MINRDSIIRMALEAGFKPPAPSDGFMGGVYDYREGTDTGASLEHFAALVASEERAVIANEFWMSVQSDLEHGVKSLNEKASSDFHKNYPSLVSFMDWLNKRGENDD
jgi:hypothetical protein